MKTNILYTIVGIILGIFGLTVFQKLNAGAFGGRNASTPDRLEQSTDMAQLKRQLELSQNRVRKLETLIGAASLANDQLNSLDHQKHNPNRIENLQELVDRAKPLIRALMEPEIEKALANGEFEGIGRFMQIADELGLSGAQKSALEDEFKKLSQEKTESFLAKLRDDDTSLFGLMKESAQWENSLSPEIDAIYKSQLSDTQYAQYQEKRFAERTQRVADKADAQLDMLNNRIPDLSATQQDQIYTVMARRSPHYDQAMEIQTGSASTRDQPALDSEEAMNAEIEKVILPHQRDEWIKYKRQQALLSGITDWAD